jgi:DNA adenine methylase
MDDLTRRGCNVLMSNSSAPLIHDLYDERYSVETVRARRNINKVGTRRDAVDELLIRNY